MDYLRILGVEMQLIVYDYRFIQATHEPYRLVSRINGGYRGSRSNVNSRLA